MQVVGRIRSSYALQVHKVTSTREEGFLFKKSSMCTNLLLINSFAVTSRRQFYMSLSHCDVDLPRRDVNFYPLCHVATWIYTSRREFLLASVTSRRHPGRRDVDFSEPLERRDVNSRRRDVV